jgi:hypothetical protein
MVGEHRVDFVAEGRVPAQCAIEISRTWVKVEAAA